MNPGSDPHATRDDTRRRAPTHTDDARGRVAIAPESTAEGDANTPARLATDDTVALEIATRARGDVASSGTDDTLEVRLAAAAPQVTAIPARAAADDAVELRRGDQVGRFTILRTLGAGGMGVVYAAYDPELDRKVALKLIRAGGGSSAARLRLHREARALGRLTHPNVVAVHDVGTHDGQVWLAMEFIEGKTLGAWRLATKPSWRQVVEVIKQAARGVAAAHKAGLLHRDIKPDNIMVGDDGRARVMDFGLARAGEELAERAPPGASSSTATSSSLSVKLTAAGAVLGTPAYMAAEQFAGRDANERTDQFSLCATLWEALYGERAFAGESFAELATAITKDRRSPTPPGAKVPSWVRRVAERGLAPDPDKRFASVDELRAALEADPRPRRWALGIAAGLALAAAAAVGSRRVQHERALAACDERGSAMDEVWSAATREQLVAGLVGTGVPYAASTAARALPWLDEFAASWRRARVELCRGATVEGSWPPTLAARAETCLIEQREQAGFLIEQLSRPGEGATGRGVVQRAITAAAGLPRVERCLDQRHLAERPLLPTGADAGAEHRRLRGLLAKAGSLAAVGEYERALVVTEEVQRDADARGWDSLRATAAWRRGALHDELGDYAKAEEALEPAFLLATRALPDVDNALVASDLARAVGVHLGRHADGQRWGELALALLDRAALPDDDLRYARPLRQLGLLKREQGEYAAAKESQLRALAILERALGPDHPEVAELLGELGAVHEALGVYDEALESERRALAILERALGPDHPHVATAVNDLGKLSYRRGAYADALEHLRRALATRERALGPEHPEVASSLNDIGAVYSAQGDHAAALEAFERVLEIRERALGPEHIKVGMALNNIGNVYLAQGAHESAIAPLQRGRAIFEKALGHDHPHVARFVESLGNVYAAQHAYDAALDAFRRVLAIREKALGPEHPFVATALNNLGALHVQRGDFEQALIPLRRALELREKTLGPEHPDTASSLTALGSVYVDQGRPEEARPLLERALAIRAASPGQPADLAETQYALARALWADREQRARARELAAAARATFREVGAGYQEQLAEVEAWLATRGS